MLTERALKTVLKKYSADQSTQPEPAELDELIPAMLAHIGTTDGELRDDLIYSSIAGWIMQNDLISKEQCRLIFTTVLDDEHLFYKIGEKDTDSVFTRTFSVLLLPPLLIKHRNSPYLDLSEVLRAKECLLRYLIAEEDRRGYVEGRGWAHGVAHCADALDYAAQCHELAVDDLREILAGLKPVITFKEFVYGFGEDERLVTPVIAMIRRGLIPADELKKWIDQLVNLVNQTPTMPQKLVSRSNLKNFLQSLYFRLSWINKDDELLRVIDSALSSINPLAGN